MAASVGAAWLTVGCGDGGKSDNQIEATPEAKNAAADVSKNYAQKYANKAARKTR